MGVVFADHDILCYLQYKIGISFPTLLPSASGRGRYFSTAYFSVGDLKMYSKLDFWFASSVSLMGVWSPHLLLVGQNFKLVFCKTVVTSQLLMHCNYTVIKDLVKQWLLVRWCGRYTTKICNSMVVTLCSPGWLSVTVVCPFLYSCDTLRGFLLNVMGKILSLKMCSYLSDSSADSYCFIRTLEGEQFSPFDFLLTQLLCVYWVL